LTKNCKTIAKPRAAQNVIFVFVAPLVDGHPFSSAAVSASAVINAWPKILT